MKVCFTLLLAVCVPIFALAQTKDSVAVKDTNRHFASYESHSVIITASVGFIDWYKNNYSLPSGFEKGTETGFDPVYFKVEYALGKHFGLAANFFYDAFYYNYSQLFNYGSGNYPRYKTDRFQGFGGGASVYYHFNELIPLKNLDVFIGAGGSVNQLKYSNYPQADSTVSKTDHSFTIIARVGARYYFNRSAAVFVDAGYDKLSFFSLGLSCRFF